LTDVVEKNLKKIGITVSKPVLAAICVVFGVIVIVFGEVLASQRHFLNNARHTAADRLHGS
jgi:hypothetical protein